MTIPANFIPIIITDEAETRQIMAEKLMTSLVIPQDIVDKKTIKTLP